MFTATHATALIIRLIISYIAANVDKVNELLAQVEVGTSLTLFQRGNLVITCSRAGGKGVLQFEWGGDQFHEIKLNSPKKAISKRVLNDLEVWYHRELRPLEQDARRCAILAIDNIQLVNQFKYFGFMDKLLGAARTVELKTSNASFDRLVETKATIKPSLFGKATVILTSSIDIGNTASPLLRVLPVHFGATQEFYVSKGEMRCVDGYARYVVQEVVDLLK